MRFLDRLAQEAQAYRQQDMTGREVVVIALLLPFVLVCVMFGGAHPLVTAFSDPASDRIGPWLGVVSVGLLWLGTFAYWAWAVRWYIRRKRRQD